METLDSFQGEILQRPPAVSAIRVEGKRSYKQARKGHAVELAPRPVTISEIKIVEMKNPFVVIDVSCGKGTYIRSIARDLGEIMGCGGTLAALRRTAIGNYPIENAWTIVRSVEASGIHGAVDGKCTFTSGVLPAAAVTAKKTVVTIGSFDGLHVGHRQILGRTIDIANERMAVPVALRLIRIRVHFWPENRAQYLDALFSFDERMQLICAGGD